MLWKKDCEEKIVKERLEKKDYAVKIGKKRFERKIVKSNLRDRLKVQESKRIIAAM